MSQQSLTTHLYIYSSVASVSDDGAVVFKDTVQVASDELVRRMKRSTSQGGESRQQRCLETLQQRLQKRLGCQGGGGGGYVYPPDWYMKCREAGVCFVSALGEECKEGDKCKYKHLSEKERRVWGVAPVSGADRRPNPPGAGAAARSSADSI